MKNRKNKIRVFAEYIYCTAIKDSLEKQILPSNIESLVDAGYKLKLKSIYSLTEKEMLKVSDEMRYNRMLPESFRNFEETQFRVSSESRNKKNCFTAMIHYVAKTDEGLKGNWFRIIRSLHVQELKSRGYDLGSFLSFNIDAKGYRTELSLEESEIAIIQ